MRPLFNWALTITLCTAAAYAADDASNDATPSQSPAPAALRVVAPPAELVESYKLSPFYKKLVSVGGFPVIGSDKVSDYALLEAGYLIRRMLAGRDDLREALIRNKVRFVVMAATEMTTDVPEHSDLTPKQYWDRRARGLGATPRRPAVSCGEENLLRLRGDPYRTENILVHEFAHAIHHMALNVVDPTFDERLDVVYRRAMEKGLWKGKYAAGNRAEYFAEGVQSYFNTNRPPDHDHNHVDTRSELYEYDPELAAMVHEVFRHVEDWTYIKPSDRPQAEHLTGFDRDTSPRFRWPDGLEEQYREHERQQRERREQRQRDGTP